MNQTTIAILCIVFLASCKPFGAGSSLNAEFEFNSQQLRSQTPYNFNSSGGTKTTVPQSGNSAESHLVSFSLGGAYNQNSHSTSDGHTVSISIKGDTQ